MKQVLQLPFANYGYGGIVEAVYEENPGPEVSGFDLLRDAVGFDVELCRGYPMLQARVREYAGPHYGRYVGWIQVITERRYRSPKDRTGVTGSQVDLSEKERALGYPFFAFGYPADFFDAPCHNLGGDAKLCWTADAFLVGYPCRMNGETVRFLVGMRWGYDEDAGGCTRIHPITAIDSAVWNGHLPLLRRDFPGWEFAEA